jgi:hypothetical protein
MVKTGISSGNEAIGGFVLQAAHMTDTSSISPAPFESADGDPAFVYKPSLMGAAFQFWLRPQAMEWSAGRRSGRIPYGDIRRVRLSFRPVTMQSNRFRAEIWPADGPKIELISSSWRSMVEQESLGPAYTAFIVELHRRIAAAGRFALLETGLAAPLYWAGLAVFIGFVLAFAALLGRVLLAGEWSGVAFIAVFFALFLWRVGAYFWRNKPGSYRADALPALLLPQK